MKEKIGEDEMAKIYYVSALSGDDQNQGTTKASPWKSLARVNQQNFQPGAQILLKRGETWQGYLRPRGSGTKEQPIRLASYGQGERPIIHGGGTSYGVYSSTLLLENQSHWRIEELEMTNYGENESVGEVYFPPVVRAGIYLLSNKQGAAIENIKIRQCYVHDVVSHTGGEVPGASAKISGGIIVLAEYRDLFGHPIIADTANTAGFKDIEISQNIIYRVMHEGIRTKVEGGRWPNYPRNGEHVTIKNNYIEKTLGDGIVMSEVARMGLVEGNIVKDCAHWLLNDIYYAAVWAHCSDHVLFQYNEVFGTMYGQKDGEAFDADNLCHHTVFQYNYSHNNRGGALLVMDSQSETIFRYNVSANDGWGEGEEIINDHATKTKKLDPSVPRIYNNTFYIHHNANRPLYGSLTGEGFAYFLNNLFIVKEGTAQLSLGKTALSPDSVIEDNVFPSPHLFKENQLAPYQEKNTYQAFSLSEDEILNHDDYALEREGLHQIEKDLMNPRQRLQARVALFQVNQAYRGREIPGNSLTKDILGREIQRNPGVGGIEF